MPVEIIPFERSILSHSEEVRKWFHRNTATRFELRLGLLPDLMMPEFFLKAPYHPVELMLIALMEGAWINADDWKVYGRLTIATRLRRKKTVLFREEFEKVQEPLMDYQLNGGTFKQQQYLQRFARRILALQVDSNYLQGCARLCLAVASENQFEACVHPLHWIRAMLATGDILPPFGMAAYQAEMYHQKLTLIKLIRTELPPDA